MQNEPTTLKMWMFSTANISPEDDKILTDTTKGYFRDLQFPYIIAHDGGYHVMVVNDIPLPDVLSPELREIYNKAIDAGISWLDIDCDADPFPGAKTFDWR